MRSERRMTLMDDLISKLDNNGKLIAYSLTSIGLCTALYKIRPFARFTNPLRVPSRFIENKTVLKGVAVRIEPTNSGILLVDHKPLIYLPRFTKSTYLPVKIYGISVTNHGISWLSTIVQGNKIEFIPIKKTPNYLDCTVVMHQQNNKMIQIGEELVKLGFATVDQIPSKIPDKTLISYEKTLISAENWAKFKRNGHWHFKIPFSRWWQIKNYCYDQLKLQNFL